MVFLTGLFASITGIIIYSKINSYMVKKRLEKAQEEELAKVINLNRMPSLQANQEGVFCLICLTNTANVVNVPCNHLALCHVCFSQQKSRYEQHLDNKLDCPICRTQIEADHCILVNYKPL